MRERNSSLRTVDNFGASIFRVSISSPINQANLILKLAKVPAFIVLDEGIWAQ
jgi:hypothetical protein